MLFLRTISLFLALSQSCIGSAANPAKKIKSTTQAPVRFLGRVPVKKNTLSWPANGLQFLFTGTQANVSFSEVTGTNYIGMTIDDEKAVRVTVQQGTSVSTPKLHRGKHRVTLHKLNEAQLGSLDFSTVSADGPIEPSAGAARHIEFVGDSITVGYGIEGVSPCSNSAQVENSLKTYAALTAANFKADFSLIAWSGRGIVRNHASNDSTNSDATVPELWTRTSALDVTSTYTFPADNVPEAVVINLGTNDFSYLDGATQTKLREPITLDALKKGYIAFAKQVRQRYPEVELFLTSSPMLSDGYPAGMNQHTVQLAALNSAATSLGGKTYVVDFPSQMVGPGLNGCDSHPSSAEHHSMAKVLIAAMSGQLKW